MDELNTFLLKIFDSIKQNLSTLDASNQRKVQQIRRQFHSFYVSLFAPGRGVFPANKIDKELSKRPTRVESARSPPRQAEPAPTGLGKRHSGKGSPGLTRKAKVTKRQQRRRATTGVKKRKGTELPASEQPPLKKLAPRPARTQLCTQLAETSQSTTEDEPATPEAASSPHDVDEGTAASDVAERLEVEPRQQLCLQVRGDGKPIVSLMRECAGAEKDNEPSNKELMLFWKLMDTYQVLDDNITRGLKIAWNTTYAAMSSDGESTVETIFNLARIPDGVTNCIRHMMGRVFIEAIAQMGKDQQNTTQIFEDFESDMSDFIYQQYIKLLHKCSCNQCQGVIKFDENYTRYR